MAAGALAGQPLSDVVSSSPSYRKLVRRRVGKRIQTVREEHNVSRQTLALLLRINRSTVFQYESGAVDLPLSRVCEIARHLKVDLHVLLCDA